MLLHEIITLPDGKLKLRNSTGFELVTGDLKEALTWLNRSCVPLSMFWDLDGDISSLLRLMPAKNLQELAANKRTDIDGVNVFYARKRTLSIRIGNTSRSFCGLAPFFSWDYRRDPKPSLSDQQKLGDQLMRELASIGIKPRRLTSHAAITDYIFDNLKGRLPTHADCPDEANQIAWEICGNAWVECHKIGLFRS